MILVDTSVWIDHLRFRNAGLVQALNNAMVLCHPFVIGEIALGRVKDRDLVLDSLTDLPTSVVATDAEVRRMIVRFSLFGLGVGYVDAHLLASVRLTPGATLSTQDRRLDQIARSWGLAVALKTQPAVPSSHPAPAAPAHPALPAD